MLRNDVLHHLPPKAFLLELQSFLGLLQLTFRLLLFVILRLAALPNLFVIVAFLQECLHG